MRIAFLPEQLRRDSGEYAPGTKAAPRASGNCVRKALPLSTFLLSPRCCEGQVLSLGHARLRFRGGAWREASWARVLYGNSQTRQCGTALDCSAF
jgi:hypothetical protein